MSFASTSHQRFTWLSVQYRLKEHRGAANFRTRFANCSARGSLACVAINQGTSRKKRNIYFRRCHLSHMSGPRDIDGSSWHLTWRAWHIILRPVRFTIGYGNSRNVHAPNPFRHFGRKSTSHGHLLDLPHTDATEKRTERGRARSLTSDSPLHEPTKGRQLLLVWKTNSIKNMPVRSLVATHHLRHIPRKPLQQTPRCRCSRRRKS